MLKLNTLTERAVSMFAATCFALGLHATDNPEWMKTLPDRAFVSAISIPGTHDTATSQLTSQQSFSQTQCTTIEEQMQQGIRAFDFRPGVDGQRMKLYHGSSATSRYMDEVLESMCSFLETHPSEFFIVHLYKASDSNKDITSQMDALIASDKIKNHIVSFNPNLTVSDIRGKILFLRRWDITWDNNSVPGILYDWDEHGFRDNKGCKIENWNGSVPLALQDYANPRNAISDKVGEMTNLLDFAGSECNFHSRYAMRWIINFASGYDSYISSNTGYAKVAMETNKAIVDYLASQENNGPTGIIMADWVGADEVELGSTKYATYGEKLVDAIIAQNVKYISHPRYQAPQLSWAKHDFESMNIHQSFRGNAEWADVNSDGNMDLVFKGRNMGNGWSTEFRVLNNNNGEFAGLSNLEDYDGQGWDRLLIPIDFNADGHIDLLHSASWDSKLALNNADNSGDFTRYNDFYLWGNDISLDDNAIEQRSQGLVIPADFDMNGFTDILMYSKGEGKGGSNFSIPYITQNYGGTNPYDKWNTGLPKLHDGTMAVGDYNRDGKPDVLVSGIDEDGNYKIAIAINTCDGEQDYSFECIYPESLQQYATIHGIVGFLDADNDGELDIFISGKLANGSKFTDIFFNEGDDIFSRAEIPFAQVCYSGADFCDINGDGFTDIIYAGECDRFSQLTTILYNLGNGEFMADDFSLAGHRGGAYIRAFDYAANGSPAIAIMGYGDSCFELYKQNRPIAKEAVIDPESISFTKSSDNGKLKLSWTAKPGMRYNYVVKTTDGKIFSAVACNPDRGIQLQGASYAATTANSVTLNLDETKAASWGVYAIAPDGTAASKIYTTTNTEVSTGVESIFDDNSNLPVYYYNLQGVKTDNPSGGIFIRRQGNKSSKVMIP